MSAAAIGGKAASLSMSHNSAGGDIEKPVAPAQPELPFRLTGSQAKTKRAIEINVDRMVREAGIERIGFLTLTVGDWEGDHFKQVFDGDEANRRVNDIARRFLPSLFARWVIVTERHKSGAVHFHLVVETRGPIRGCYDWAAVRAGDYTSALAGLREIWAVLRRELPAFGFGRAQLEPAKGGESLARYVAKYVEKNLFASNRGTRKKPGPDFGKKLVRYGGWKQTHCRSNDIAWATPRAAAWRAKAATLAALVGATRETIAQAVGPRWSFRVTEEMNLFNDTRGDGEQLRPMEIQTWPLRSLAISRMRDLCSSQWLRAYDLARARSPLAWRPGKRSSIVPDLFAA